MAAGPGRCCQSWRRGSPHHCWQRSSWRLQCTAQGNADMPATRTRKHGRWSVLSWHGPGAMKHNALSVTAGSPSCTAALTCDTLLVGVLWALAALIPKAQDIELPLMGEHLVQARPPPFAGDSVVGAALGADDWAPGHASKHQLQQPRTWVSKKAWHNSPGPWEETTVPRPTNNCNCHCCVAVPQLNHSTALTCGRHT
jgi:hypothetical protein